MRKILIVLGSIFAVIIVVGVIGFSILAVKGGALDEESKAYVDDVTPKILTSLNQETLFQFASDELKSSASQEEFDKIFNWFGKLGKFVEYKESKGQANISVTTQSGKQITARYEAQAEFEAGPAAIKVSIIKKGESWQVVGFNINSMALATQ
jgi:hypothetical protein